MRKAAISWGHNFQCLQEHVLQWRAKWGSLVLNEIEKFLTSECDFFERIAHANLPSFTLRRKGINHCYSA